MKRYRILLLLPLLLAASCCTKVDCINTIYQPFYFTYHGFSDAELRNARVYIADNNYQVLDSFINDYYYTTNSIQVYDRTAYITSNPLVNMENRIFISSISNRRDTMKNFRYDAVQYEHSCNKCYPFGHDKQVSTRYENYRYEYKSQTIQADSLLIVK